MFKDKKGFQTKKMGVNNLNFQTERKYYIVKVCEHTSCEETNVQHVTGTRYKHTHNRLIFYK